MELAIEKPNSFEAHLEVTLGHPVADLTEKAIGVFAKKSACSATNACLALDGAFQNEVSLDLQRRWISGEITTEQRVSLISARYKGDA